MDPTPRITAGALATFLMTMVFGTGRWTVGSFFGIEIVETSSVFYKIKVTQKLDQTVCNGVYLTMETIVERYIPIVPGVPRGTCSR